jgi:hypothetical protein
MSALSQTSFDCLARRVVRWQAERYQFGPLGGGQADE